MIVEARLKTKELDGIEVMVVPIGTEYFIDLDSKVELNWFNLSTNHGRKVEAVLDVVNGGWIPFELLELLP